MANSANIDKSKLKLQSCLVLELQLKPDLRQDMPTFVVTFFDVDVAEKDNEGEPLWKDKE